MKLVSQTTRVGRLGLHFWQSVKTSCIVLVCENNSYLSKLGLVIMSKNHTKLGPSGHPAYYFRKPVCCIIGFSIFLSSLIPPLMLASLPLFVLAFNSGFSCIFSDNAKRRRTWKRNMKKKKSNSRKKLKVKSNGNNNNEHSNSNNSEKTLIRPK